MIAVREPVAPPHPWMLTVWDHDAQGLPVRHRPGTPHGDLWISRCSDEATYRFVFLMDHDSLSAIMELRPCLECLVLGDWL